MQRKKTSLENAFLILKLFTIDEPEMSVTEVSKRLNISKSTAYRLLSSLLAEDFVYQNPKNSLYSLGSSILSLVNIVNTQIHISTESIPILDAIVQRTNESAHLSIIESTEIVYIQTIKGKYLQPNKNEIKLGTRRSAILSASGQIFLALQRENRMGYAYNSDITTLPPSQLEEIKKNHYAIAINDNEIEIAVPVYKDNEVIAALSITAKSRRLQSSRIKKNYVHLLQHTSEQLENIIKMRKKGELLESSAQ